jgi:hypothetical protein
VFGLEATDPRRIQHHHEHCSLCPELLALV